MSFHRILMKAFIIILCFHLCLAQQKTVSFRKDCTQDHDCPKEQFCENNRECKRCINCKDYKRNTGLSSSCLKDVAECGSCLDGYDEVRHRYDHSLKDCMKPAELAATNDKKDYVLVEGSSEEAPSHTTATVITIAVVVIAVGAVIAAMGGVYMYMKRGRIADAGQPDDDDDKVKQEKGGKDLSRVVELQIVHANPNLARRQEWEDEIHALQAEITPIRNNEGNESDTKEPEQTECNQATLPMSHSHNNKDTIVNENDYEPQPT